MKFSIVILCLFLFATTQAAIAGEWTESIKLNFALDERDWEVGWQNKTDDMYILEFVIKGQTVDNWKELITFEFFPGLQRSINCTQFAEGFVQHLKQSEPNTRVTVLYSKPNDALIEWVVTGSTKNPCQDELDRFLLGKQGIHMVHYVKKTKSLTEAERNKWIKFLESATLIEGK